MEKVEHSLLFEANIPSTTHSVADTFFVKAPHSSRNSLDVEPLNLLKIYGLAGAIQDYHISIPLVPTTKNNGTLTQEIIFTHKQSQLHHRYHLEKESYITFSATKTSINLTETAALVCHTLAATSTNILTCELQFLDDYHTQSFHKTNHLNTYTLSQKADILASSSTQIIITPFVLRDNDFTHAMIATPIYTQGQALKDNVTDTRIDNDLLPDVDTSVIPPVSSTPNAHTTPSLNTSLSLDPQIYFADYTATPLHQYLSISADANLQLTLDLSFKGYGGFFISAAGESTSLSFQGNIDQLKNILLSDILLMPATRFYGHFVLNAQLHALDATNLNKHSLQKSSQVYVIEQPENIEITIDNNGLRHLIDDITPQKANLTDTDDVQPKRSVLFAADNDIPLAENDIIPVNNNTLVAKETRTDVPSDPMLSNNTVRQELDTLIVQQEINELV